MTSAHEFNISLRRVGLEDQEFLYTVYAGTRREELAPVPWTAAEKDAFLRSQFNAQHQHYQQHYPDASFQIILCDAQDVGRLYVDRGEKEIHIVDISLLPGHRGLGIGSVLLRGLMAEAAESAKRLSIYVEQFNPARRLYERLGFKKKADAGVYVRMEWSV